MSRVARHMVEVQVRAVDCARSGLERLRDSRGQATLEYVGIVVAVLVLAGIVAVFLKGDLGNSLVDAIKDKLSVIGITDGGDPTPVPSSKKP